MIVAMRERRVVHGNDLELPHAALQWIDGAGHDPAHPAMVTAMVNALDAYAERGAFDAAVPAQ